MIKTGFLFTGVGVAAAITHLLVFKALIQTTPLWPEICNGLGFVVAFSVSFAGHRWLSFADTRQPFWSSLWRFAATALLGFASNELVFMLGYRVFSWPDLFSLVVAMGLAAVQTFFLSRYWAFVR
jgi:putative flippase GtrA